MRDFDTLKHNLREYTEIHVSVLRNGHQKRIMGGYEPRVREATGPGASGLRLRARRTLPGRAANAPQTVLGAREREIARSRI